MIPHNQFIHQGDCQAHDGKRGYGMSARLRMRAVALSLKSLLVTQTKKETHTQKNNSTYVNVKLSCRLDTMYIKGSRSKLAFANIYDIFITSYN